jgi:hypothetical protein
MSWFHPPWNPLTSTEILASFIRALTPSGILHDGHGLLIAHLKPGVWFHLAGP